MSDSRVFLFTAAVVVLLAAHVVRHTSKTMTDEQRKSVAIEYLRAFDNGGRTSDGGSILDDASFVGQNPGSLVAPGGAATYRYFAPREGAFLVTSHGATFGADGGAGNNASGLFAVVNVEPAGAVSYRSQVTEEELRLATRRDASGAPLLTAGGQPVLVTPLTRRSFKDGQAKFNAYLDDYAFLLGALVHLRERGFLHIDFAANFDEGGPSAFQTRRNILDRA